MGQTKQPSQEVLLGILEGARELISDENRWCPDRFARNKRGATVPPGYETASRWDVIGAIEKITGVTFDNPPASHAVNLLDEKSYSVHDMGVFAFEIKSDHESVIRFLDSVIGDLKSEQGGERSEQV